MRILFITILINVFFCASGQTAYEDLPVKSSPTNADGHTVVSSGEPYRMTTEVLQEDIYDSLGVHLDSLQAHNVRILAVEGTATDSSFATVQTDSIYELTTDHGVDIEALRIKDDELSNPTQPNTSIDIVGNNTLGMRINSNTVGYFTVNGLEMSGTMDLSTIEGHVQFNDANTLIWEDSSSNLTFRDDVTGIKTLAELAAGGGTADSAWTSINTDTITEKTTDQGVLIETVLIKDGAFTIPAGASTVSMSGAANGILLIQNEISSRDLTPAGSTYDIGQSDDYWDDVYATDYFIGDGNTSIILSSGDLTFDDANTGTKTLAELATPPPLSINAQTGTTYTLVLTDENKLVTLSNAAAITLTVPPNSSVAFPVGAQITIVGIDAGQVTVDEGSGVTVNSADSRDKLRVQYSSATLIKTATDAWLLLGDISL